MDINIIDNFLTDYELNNLKNDLNHNKSFPLYYSHEVAGERVKGKGDYWNYYFTHLFYNHDNPKSNYYGDLYNMFIPKFKELYP